MYLARDVTRDLGRGGEGFGDESEDGVSSRSSTETGVESSRRTFLKAAGGGGATFALAAGGSTGKAEAQEAKAQPGGVNGGFKAYSGVLQIRRPARRGNTDYSAVIEFEDWPDKGDIVDNTDPEGALRVNQVTQVNGSGRFDEEPAALVTFREPRIEDKGRGNREIDRWDFGHLAFDDRLEIFWRTHEGNSFHREIVFLVMGV